jgi:benzoate/toluate 1,2-dioxygenase alpha subunit
MATPDDLAEFNNVQRGCLGRASKFSDFSRGASHQVAGADRYATEIGVKPETTGVSMADEGIYVGQYQNWLRLMIDGVKESAGV